MKAGDFVEVDYVGRIKETGQVFDLTREDVAKAEGVYNPKTQYGSVVLIVGSEFLIRGLDKALRKMEVGAKEKVEIPPEGAFGEKNSDLVKLIPLAKFKEQNLDPVPGAVVNIGAMKGTIASVSGGRVKVDFNHPLAGKTLEYDIEIKSQITGKKERIAAVVKYFTGISDVGVTVNKKEVEIEIKKRVDVTRPVKIMVAKTAVKWCDMDGVKFVETFEKSEFEEPGESELVGSQKSDDEK